MATKLAEKATAIAAYADIERLMNKYGKDTVITAIEDWIMENTGGSSND